MRREIRYRLSCGWARRQPSIGGVISMYSYVYVYALCCCCFLLQQHQHSYGVLVQMVEASSSNNNDAWNTNANHDNHHPDSYRRGQQSNERRRNTPPWNDAPLGGDNEDGSRESWGQDSSTADTGSLPTAPPSQWDDNHGNDGGSSLYAVRRSHEEDRSVPPTAPPWQYDDGDGPSQQRYYEAGTEQPQPKQQQQQTQQQQYAPIHYQFQSKSQVDESLQDGRGRRQRGDVTGRLASLDPSDDAIPVTWNAGEDDAVMFSRHSSNSQQQDWDDADPSYAASPRRDAVTRYMSTTKGRLLLRMSSGTVGYTIGAFAGKSLLNRPHSVGFVFCILFLACTFLRNPYGELSRAMGLALIYALQRTQGIRRRYPAFPQIQACVGAGPRRPLPRSENPWNSPENEPFQMMYSLIAMAVVGSMCGGNLPIIPTWMGALGGAGFFAFITTVRSARGDLARTMGMRVVALLEEVLDINAELRVLQKLGVVSGKLFDKMMILDRKHRIKDKIVSVMSWAYNQAARTASQVQSEMQEDGGNPADDVNNAGRRDDRRDYGNYDRRSESRGDPRGNS